MEYMNKENININDFAYVVQQHADKLFPNRTPASMFMKLFSEIGELVEAQSEEEFADVMIMLLDYGSKHMFDIEGAVRKKMTINETRKWETNELGVSRHVDPI